MKTLKFSMILLALFLSKTLVQAAILPEITQVIILIQ